MPRLFRVRRSHRPRYRRLILAVCLAFGVAGPVDAQLQGGAPSADWSDDIPAHVAARSGIVYLDRDGQVEEARENEPLVAGDRLLTHDGRVEVLFSDGSVLDIDRDSSVTFQADDLLHLTAGRVRLELTRAAGTIEYRIDAAGSSIIVRTAGEYRVDVTQTAASDGEVRLGVRRGVAELSNAAGRTLVRAGYGAVATGRDEPSLPFVVNVSAADDFDRWTVGVRDDRRGLSAQYLPSELRYYSGTFDRDGWWRFQPDAGYVWYPRVGAEWRPYVDGGWSYVGVWGWTWVGAPRWDWPTHHYGRWGISNDGWYWIPGRRWGPAWVSWASAPGYVAWCPLGWDNRPVVPLTQVAVLAARDPRGWTILSERAFAGRHVTPVTAAAARVRLADNRAFAPSAVAPIRPSVIDRDAAPLRAPAARARWASGDDRRTEDVTVMPPRGRIDGAAARRMRAAGPDVSPASPGGARTREVMPPSRGDDAPRAALWSRAPAAAPQRPTREAEAPTANRSRQGPTAGRGLPAGSPPGERTPPARPRLEPPIGSRSSPGQTQPSPRPESPRSSGGTARSRSIPPAPAPPPPPSHAPETRDQARRARGR